MTTATTRVMSGQRFIRYRLSGVGCRLLRLGTIVPRRSDNRQSITDNRQPPSHHQLRSARRPLPLHDPGTEGGQALESAGQLEAALRAHAHVVAQVLALE